LASNRFAPNGYYNSYPNNLPWSYGTRAPAGSINTYNWGGYAPALVTAPYGTWNAVPWQYGCAKASTNLQSVTGPEGVRAYQFSVAKTDDPMGLASSAPRAEFDQVDPAAQRLDYSVQLPYMIDENTGERFYTLAVYIPNATLDGMKVLRWSTLWQYHADNTANMQGSGGIATWGGSNGGPWLVFQRPFADPLNPSPLAKLDLTKYVGQWVKLGVATKWTAASDGYIQYYLNGSPIGAKYTGKTVLSGEKFYLKQGFYMDYTTHPGQTLILYETPLMESRTFPTVW
jgi:hypothetical protein